MFVDSDEHGDIGRTFAATSTTSITLSNELKPIQLKRRSASWSAAFYSSTIVPALSDSEALSSLITSLASISNAAKALSSTENFPRPNQEATDRDDLIVRVATAPDIQNTLDQHDTIFADRDFCPPPVAGYTTSFDPKLPNRPKTSGNDTRSQARFTKKSLSNLRINKSPKPLQSPDSFRSAFDYRPTGNESVSSLPLSVNSKISKSRSPLKLFFSSKMGDQTIAEPALQQDPHKASDASAENVPMAMTIPEEPDLHRMSAFVHPEKLTELDNYQSDSKTLSSLSPSLRAELGENQIPSRRSSLRNGMKRLSTSSKDLKSLNIDQDLIEENDSTVQRIRELQQARERRHKEWRREARKSERAAKRASLPSQSPGRQSCSTRNSWHSRVSDSESRPTLLSRLSGENAFDLSTTAEEPTQNLAIPKISEQPSELKRNLSSSASVNASLSSIKRHRKGLSGTIRRSPSFRHSISDDIKSVANEVEAYLASPRLTQKIRHPRTGRTIAFSEVGDPDGFVVICCVGMGLTRYITAFYDEMARAQRLRIITPDRPAVGETSAMPEGRSAPLAWVDDVAVICSSLGIEKFSLLAHSAGAIYALATALKMPQYIRGRIHLMAPWIPPSQLAASQNGHTRPVNLPVSHKILSFLPASFMKAANSRFLTATSASIEPASKKQRKKDHAAVLDLAEQDSILEEVASWSLVDVQNGAHTLPTPEASPTRHREAVVYHKPNPMYSPPISPVPNATPQRYVSPPTPKSSISAVPRRAMTPHTRDKLYNTVLTQNMWSLATLNANPAVDLVICLERRRPIGFRYTDITRCVVIHHGANDNRVPLENVRWLSSVMKRCELRVLDNEGHGLMANATFMSNVLAEVGKEWEEWSDIVKEKERQRLRQEREAIAQGKPTWRGK